MWSDNGTVGCNINLEENTDTTRLWTLNNSILHDQDTKMQRQNGSNNI